MIFKYTPAFLRKLEELFEEAAYLIRYEKGSFQSGYCVLEARKIVVVNKFLPVEGRIHALLEILPALQVPEEALSPEMAKLYHQVLAKPQEADPPKP